ncbi:MAG: DegT/DnrJ/EryC1/StrS family aminotransferase [Gemmatimonadota bacterium]
MTSPTPVPFLDLTEQFDSIRDEISEALERVVESQYFVLGPEVQRLEDEVAAYLTGAGGAASGKVGPGAPDDAGGDSHDSAEEGEPLFAVGCASGTDAILLPFMALREGAGVGGPAPDGRWHGDVIVPAFTFFATAGAVWNAGFRPVFCDVDPETFNVTGETVDAAWTDDTRAVIPVHLFGQMAPMEEVTAVVSDRIGGASGGCLVLEDAAQAIGAHRNGRPAGTMGDCASFSFFPTKNLGGFGDGGMITTRSPELAERLSKLRVHGGLQMYHHEMVGTNSRLDALQAAVLRVKLPHLDRWAAERRENARLYDALLAEVDGVQTPVTDEGNLHTYNQYTLRAEDRDGLRKFLSERDIGSGLYYPVPLHLQECFGELGYEEGDLRVSEELSRQVVSLPIFPELGRGRIELVVEAIREYYGA